MSNVGGIVAVNRIKAGVAKNKKIIKVGVASVSLVLVFALGLGIGKGEIGFSHASKQSASLPANLNFSSVEKVYDTLRAQYDGKLDENSLLDGAKKGLVESAGDPYTVYMSAEKTKEFDDELNGSFTGIGAELGKEGDNIIIVSPISGFPADKAGLKAKDVIMEIDGKSAAGLGVDDAVKQIRGPKDTQVKLRVARDSKEDLTFTMTRTDITTPSVESKTLDNNIGYIHISRFSDDTVQLTREAATKFKEQNVKGIVLDVRGDPGGLLDAAVGVSSLWLPADKTVLQEKRDGKVIKTYYSNGNPILQGVPTVVLIDGGSASASEITAGALKDNGAAILMGVKSYGKGSVQNVNRLNDGSSIKITIARWYTPKDVNIDKEGIQPDKKVEQNTGSAADEQLDSATAELNK